MGFVRKRKFPRKNDIRIVRGDADLPLWIRSFARRLRETQNEVSD